MESVLTESAQRVRRNLVVFAFGLVAFSTPWAHPIVGGEVDLFRSGVAFNEHLVLWGGWILVLYSVAHFWFQARYSVLRLAEQHDQDKLAAAYQIAESTNATDIANDIRAFNEKSVDNLTSVVQEIYEIHGHASRADQTIGAARKSYELLMAQAPEAFDWHVMRKSGQWAAGKGRRYHQKWLLGFELTLTFGSGVASLIAAPLLFYLL